MLYDRVLVPFDGSESAEAALAEAVRFARQDPGMTLNIIQFADSEKLVIAKLEAQGRAHTAVNSSAELHALYDDALSDADAHLRKVVDPLIRGLMNAVVIEVIEETLPGEQIVSYAEEQACDLIIMGSRGLGAIRGMLGSVSNHVLRSANIPVLIVKHQE